MTCNASSEPALWCLMVQIVGISEKAITAEYAIIIYKFHIIDAI
jgi:hypothetical protein